MSAHGTRSAYVQGCRCLKCLEAERVYHRQYYHQWKHSQGGKAWRERRKQRQQELRRAAPRRFDIPVVPVPRKIDN